MPVLNDSRYELVAKGLAEGKTQAEAYSAAGFKTRWPDRACTQLLSRHPEVRERAVELRQAADARANEVLHRAMDAAAVSKAYVLRRLHEMAERCMQHHPVLDDDGQQVYVETPGGNIAPAFTFDAKGAKGALHLIGLELGMFVHRVRFEKSPLDDLPAPVLKEMLANLIALKEGRIIEHKDGNQPTGASEPAGQEQRALVDRSAAA